mmetsp:Transcript_55293/g.129407  ORF Transcript_55293/g.129407 Transcript_55293/m.129407 type:complete len:220 (+) Transcript_55293:711-1370(+)
MLLYDRSRCVMVGHRLSNSARIGISSDPILLLLSPSVVSVELRVSLFARAFTPCRFSPTQFPARSRCVRAGARPTPSANCSTPMFLILFPISSNVVILELLPSNTPTRLAPPSPRSLWLRSRCWSALQVSMPGASLPTAYGPSQLPLRSRCSNWLKWPIAKRSPRLTAPESPISFHPRFRDESSLQLLSSAATLFVPASPSLDDRRLRCLSDLLPLRTR